MTDLALAAREGWPDGLAFLLRAYPRETWYPDPARQKADLGETTRFWLRRHDMFREIGGGLMSRTARFREGDLPLADFKSWFAPRLGFFLRELDAHHRIEDEVYFPLFRAAEPRLERGFDVLENDHEVIHARIAAAVEAANAFLGAADADEARRTGDAYALAGAALVQNLLTHLADEEDLIVPLLIDRTEGALGL